ncbi:lactonase family protein [Burkholderia alba]|uniref:lactonase family protein n=1 Tax=Burkholderia alba TaxID=2683677 RepID=UPI002B05FE9D|nr:beta-propeller fold lactonase family protein [Burkholderia alba]
MSALSVRKRAPSVTAPASAPHGAPRAIAHAVVSNADSRDLSVFRLDAEGGLTLVDTVPVEGTAMPLALSPERTRLYVALRSTPYRVLSFALDRRSGALRRLGEAPLPDSMAYLSTDRTGRFLFAASYGGGLVSVNAIDADGVAGDVRQVVATGPKSHSIVSTPDNRHVYAAVLGDDAWLRFAFDPVTGRLGEPAARTVALPARSGPRHAVFSADGRLAYLIDELDGGLHVVACDGDAASPPAERIVQTVSILPDGFDTLDGPWGAELRMTPDGRFLYASERRSSTLAGYRIEPATGHLSRIGTWPAEPHPRGFGIDPSGRYLIAAGQLSHRLRVYRIGAADGGLTPLGVHRAGDNPNWVEIVAID